MATNVKIYLACLGGRRRARDIDTPAWHAADPHVHFHFTPTYSSWLNQVELWFAKIERDVIARGIFTSVSDLRKKLRQYIALHSKTAQPFH